MRHTQYRETDWIMKSFTQSISESMFSNQMKINSRKIYMNSLFWPKSISYFRQWLLSMNGSPWEMEILTLSLFESESTDIRSSAHRIQTNRDIPSSLALKTSSITRNQPLSHPPQRRMSLCVQCSRTFPYYSYSLQNTLFHSFDKDIFDLSISPCNGIHKTRKEANQSLTFAL